jgi:hypothetical protein
MAHNVVVLNLVLIVTITLWFLLFADQFAMLEQRREGLENQGPCENKDINNSISCEQQKLDAVNGYNFKGFECDLDAAMYGTSCLQQRVNDERNFAKRFAPLPSKPQASNTQKKTTTTASVVYNGPSTSFADLYNNSMKGLQSGAPSAIFGQTVQGYEKTLASAPAPSAIVENDGYDEGEGDTSTSCSTNRWMDRYWYASYNSAYDLVSGECTKEALKTTLSLGVDVVHLHLATASGTVYVLPANQQSALVAPTLAFEDALTTIVLADIPCVVLCTLFTHDVANGLVLLQTIQQTMQGHKSFQKHRLPSRKKCQPDEPVIESLLVALDYDNVLRALTLDQDPASLQQNGVINSLGEICNFMFGHGDWIMYPSLRTARHAASVPLVVEDTDDKDEKNTSNNVRAFYGAYFHPDEDLLDKENVKEQLPLPDTLLLRQKIQCIFYPLYLPAAACRLQRRIFAYRKKPTVTQVYHYMRSKGYGAPIKPPTTYGLVGNVVSEVWDNTFGALYLMIA